MTRHKINPLHQHKCYLTHHHQGRINETVGRCKCECGHRWRQNHRQKPKSLAPTRMKKWASPR